MFIELADFGFKQDGLNTDYIERIYINSNKPQELVIELSSYILYHKFDTPEKAQAMYEKLRKALGTQKF